MKLAMYRSHKTVFRQFTGTLVMAGLIVCCLLQSCDLESPPAPVLNNPWDPNNPGIPRTPMNLASRPLTEAEILITWEDMSGNEDGFKLTEMYYIAESLHFEYLEIAADTDSMMLTARLPATAYWYQLAVYNEAGESTSPDTAFTSTVETIPTQPADFRADVISETAILLTWSDMSANETSFSIYERIGVGGSVEIIAQVDADSTAIIFGNRTTFLTYYYMVRAVNDFGASPIMTEIEATPGSFAPHPPLNLTGEVLSETVLTLSWVDNSLNEERFEIWESVDESGNFTLAQDVTSGSTSWTFEDRRADITYRFKVCAANRYGQSEFTDTYVISTSETVPFPPSGLEAQVAHETAISLSWNDNSSIETGLVIEQSIDDSLNFIVVDTTATNSTSIVFEKRVLFTEYYYRIFAMGLRGNSGYSSQAAVIAGSVSPTAPESLECVATSPTTIELIWLDRSQNEEGFEIWERTPPAGDWHLIETTDSDVENLSLTGRFGGRTYLYWLRSINRFGVSDFTAEVEVTTPSIPAAPSDLDASGISATEIRMTWVDAADNEEGFIVEEKIGVEGNFVQIADLPPNSVEYTISDKQRLTTYYYRVKAYNIHGASGYSNIDSAIPFSTIAVVAASYQGIVCVDITDPANPIQIGELDTPGQAQDITIVGSYGYVADLYGGLRIIDLSDPSDPSEVGYLDTRGRVNRVDVKSPYCYIADGDSGIVIADVNDPARPRERGRLLTPGTAVDVEIIGDVLYVAASGAGVVVVNVSNPSFPSQMSVFETPSATYGIDNHGHMDYPYLHIADYSSGYRQINISDPENLVEIRFANTPGYAMDVVEVSGIVFVADYAEGLMIFNPYSDPPTEIGSIDTPGSAWKLAIYGDIDNWDNAVYCCIADDRGGLRIIDVQDTSDPQEIAYFGTDGPAMGVAIIEIR